MAFGNEKQDYQKTSGKSGFYACHAQPYKTEEVKKQYEPLKQKKQTEELSDRLKEN